MFFLVFLKDYMKTEKGHNGKSKLTSFHVTSIRIFKKKRRMLKSK